MLQQDQAFARHSGFLRHTVQVRNSPHQMTQQLSVPGIVRHVAGLVALHFLDLSQVVDNDACQQQVPVQPGIDLQQRLGEAEHVRGVVQQSAAFRVVHPLRRREPGQPFAGNPQHAACQFLQILVFEALNRLVDIFQHILRLPRRTGHQHVHVHRILVRAQPPFFYPQLKPSVIFLNRSANLDRLSRFRRFRHRIPVPDLAVDLTGSVRQVHIHIVAAFAVFPLFGGADQQESFKPHIPLQRAY